MSCYYKNNPEYIKSKLQENYVFEHKKFGPLKVQNILHEDDDISIEVLEINNESKIRQLSFKTLYDKKLVVDNDLFQFCEVEEKAEKRTANIEDSEFNKLKLTINNVKTPAINKEIKYSDLFKMMEDGDKTEFRYSRWFWHYTHVKNLVAIIADGRFQARYNIENNIIFDIKKHSYISKEVQETNASRFLQRHVRFYLRPLNASFFRAKNSFDHEDDIVWVSITKDALYRSNNSTFLYYKNAHSATDDVFSKENQLNHKYGRPFIFKNLELFNFEETYSLYDKDQSLKRKNYQQAEFLVWKDLSITFIQYIYFRSSNAKDKFLNSIKHLSCYNQIKEKCVVNSDLFYASGYK